MARLRDSRSPTPAGSQQPPRRHRRDDDRRDRDRYRDRDRRDFGRDPRRRSRSRSPHDRRNRDRDRDRDHDFRRRDRSADRRDDDYYRGGRDRRRSRDRPVERERDRSAEPRRRRSRDRDSERDHRNRRDDSRDRGRGRREGTADSHPRSRRGDSRDRGPAPNDTTKAKTSDAESKPNPAPAQTDADKKAERLAKLAAWKKKQEEKEKQKDATPGGTRKLLAEMDEKANAAPSNSISAGASPAPISPAEAQVTSPAAPYAGKFDPKAIAKKAAPKVHSSSAAPKLGVVAGQPSASIGSTTKLPSGEYSYQSITLHVADGISEASALPQSRAKASGFGFHKQNAETEKVSQKRKLMLDEDEASDRKLAKLPSLSLDEVDDTPYENQDEEDDYDADHFVGDEAEEAAAARAAQERREERIAQENAQQATEMQLDQAEEDKAPATNGVTQAAQKSEAMEVDEDDVDPLDAFMNDLETKPVADKPLKASLNQKKDSQEPEAYFSDDEYDYRNENVDPDSFLAIAAKARKKKDIPSVDYSKIDLEPVRKNFWVEPAELSEMTEVELADLRIELDGIKVSGKDVPKPVQKWSQCALSRKTLDIIESLGYEKPTPIQMQAFPAIMSGRDVIGVAKTGSGKTLAFLLPMFRHIKDQRPLKENEGPIGLIMTPTRELATQIHRDCKPFLKSMNLRAVCAYGGAPIKDHIAELKRGAEIVVCTPGRMIDLLAANQGRVTNLKRVTYVVLDEADRMFDMGFEPQVMKIFANMRPDRQTILFSATMPRIMDALAKKVLNSPIEITVGGRSVVAPEITQVVEIREENTKFVRLLELLGELYDKDEDARTLVFVDRQEKADDLLKELLRKGYPCIDSTIEDFKHARGLDVKQLKLVVNYDAPNHLEDYVHRAGRTGRAGNKGTAVTFVTGDQENCAPGIAKALEQSGQPVPPQLDEMRKAFRDKVKSGKAKDQSGFGGKGLERLDQEREAARLRERKSHRTEGDEEEDKKEEKTGEDKKGDKALSAIQTAASGIISRDSAPKVDLEPKFTIHKREDAAPSSSANNPLDKVSSAINAINARLGRAGQLRPGQPIDNKGPDAGAFHATLEINDFPQKARWAATGTSITNKGTFYPPGKEVPPGGEPKLYVLVEGDTELMEGTIAAADADSRAPIGGRYTVT
ncbi:P-loop containing nucleoside triphosphate hydrolase protein [Hypoxylon sp. NC0597]|nr:P-loop containing nucleoside triphosphate hydrolase protein [Hypoxylon sp. NC0597]